jgi:hypothetical protein
MAIIHKEKENANPHIISILVSTHLCTASVSRIHYIIQLTVILEQSVIGNAKARCRTRCEGKVFQ